MTITSIKSSKSQIEKIKNNFYYESQSKNKKEKKLNKEIKHTNHNTVIKKK